MSATAAYLAGVATLPVASCARWLVQWGWELDQWSCLRCGKRGRWPRAVIANPGRWAHVHVGRRVGRCAS